MNEKYVIAILVLVAIILVGSGYYWKTAMQKSASEQAVENVQKTTTSGTADVSPAVVPTTDAGTVNSTESVESANPYDKTNPFSTIKVNPFE